MHNSFYCINNLLLRLYPLQIFLTELYVQLSNNKGICDAYFVTLVLQISMFLVKIWNVNKLTLNYIDYTTPLNHHQRKSEANCLNA